MLQQPNIIKIISYKHNNYYVFFYSYNIIHLGVE